MFHQLLSLIPSCDTPVLTRQMCHNPPSSIKDHAECESLRRKDPALKEPIQHPGQNSRPINGFVRVDMKRDGTAVRCVAHLLRVHQSVSRRVSKGSGDGV